MSSGLERVPIAWNHANFCVDESGAAALEYGLILTLITMGVLAAIRYMGQWTLGVFDTVGNNLTSS